MYNSNPSQAPFPPMSLLDRSFRVMMGAVGWCKIAHAVHTDCAHALDLHTPLRSLALQHTLTLHHP